MKNFLYNWKNKKSGVTLIDSIVAVVIVAVGLAAVLTLYTRGTNYRYMAGMRQKALQIAAENIEVLKKEEASLSKESDVDVNYTKILDKIDELNAPNDSPGTLTRHVVVLGDAGEQFVTRVDVIDPSNGAVSTDATLKEQSNLTGDDHILLVRSTVTYAPDPNSTEENKIAIDTYIKLPQKES